MSGAVFELKDNQRLAVDPDQSIWLSASAGTGKTQVLSARVLRLLLEPRVSPSDILCLTFTKAGAAEMAVRINAVLARWVRLEPAKLAIELGHIGADIGPQTQARARTLFASVLDCPGGGLRIDTIHAFAQWLLANFPNEADIIPGARPMEDRERDVLSRKVLGDMLSDAEQGGDQQLLDNIAEFVRRKDPDALQAWLMRCANMQELWEGPASFTPPLRPRVLQMLGAPSNADEGWATEALGSDVFPDETLRFMVPVLREVANKTTILSLDLIADWLNLTVAKRLERIGEFEKCLLKSDGEPRAKGFDKVIEKEPDFSDWQSRVAVAVANAKERKAILALAEFLSPALEMGRTFALRWDAAKKREGLLDFDDLIRRAAQLLSNKQASDWIRFKLDRQFNHVLIDEAQDTNEAQWDIFDALIDDFFSGEGASPDTMRTVFTVGDYKQAIFGFQGTSPENFEAAKLRVSKTMGDAVQNAASVRRNAPLKELRSLDLGRSFRTADVVLQFVDRMIAAIGPDAIGLKDTPPLHEGDERAGLVTLWEPVRGQIKDADSEKGNSEENDDEGGAETWLARHDRHMAENIAQQVERWTSGAEPFLLEKGDKKPRAATPGDIMVLVRSRKEVASLIVARLHAKGVPVAGVDRLRLGAPLAVKDLLAAARFAIQPLDDLSLANLLSSPLMGWSQDDILKHVPRKKGRGLWSHLRDCHDLLVMETCAKLSELLKRADFETPEALLNWMLVGPWKGRSKLIARLGHEANDPIDELINAAFAYESIETPSLAGFLHWFDAGDGELKRDPGDTPDLVRVMTVHGSKGLQAPIVILADATNDPGKARSLTLDDVSIGQDRARKVPMPGVSKDDRAGALAKAHEDAEANELQEHWRLLYVAMTRAEEALFIGGSLGAGKKEKPKEPHEDSWYARIASEMGEDVLADDIWGGRREWGYRVNGAASGAVNAENAKVALPDWAYRAAPEEARPPRPLAPSSLGASEDVEAPIATGYSIAAARRGVLIHALLERLPQVPLDQREALGAEWLGRQAKDMNEIDRSEILSRALNVIKEPQFADVFGPDALAEVPLSAVVAGEVVTGVVDRLLVTGSHVVVVDFKTARRAPQNSDAIPRSTIKQMAAYVAALSVIYPDREVRAAVLYTQTPQIFALSPEQLASS